VAVEQIATSGRLLDVLVGPAGTGKTTAMAGLRAVWEAQHGPRSVLGMAPSAAAEALADELGVTTDNTAKWLTETRKQAQRLADIDRLRAQLPSLRPGSRSYQSVMERVRAIAANVEQWRLRPGQLVIVDEASLAGTFTLDELVGQAADAGAKVVLVGDWAQLSAIEAGGAFALLVADRKSVPELSDVRRFTNRWEQAASIKLRTGDPTAVAAYSAHDRIAEGSRDEMLEALYQAWKRDIVEGKSSLMIAADGVTVSALNERARADRVAAGQTAPNGIEVAGGIAGVGDRVVTRENDRRLVTGKRWVKNGDQWIVTSTKTNGSMTVQRINSPDAVVLPADYVRHHLELSYATTALRAQGATVDTAHFIVGPTATREVLYVATTRGRQSNQLYVDTCYDPDHDTSHGESERQTVEEVLTLVLARVGAEQSAHTMIRQAHDAAESIATLVAEYQTLARAAQDQRWTALLVETGLSADQINQIRQSDAYGPLVAAFRDAEGRGLNIAAAFPVLVRSRTLIGVDDSAAVLHGRMHRWIDANDRGQRPATGPLIAGLVPAALNVTDPDMHQALIERAGTMEARARSLAQQAVNQGAHWTRVLGPPPVDPARRQAWFNQLATIAAYEDHWGASVFAPVGDGDRRNIEQFGEAKRAKEAAQRAQSIARHDTENRVVANGMETRAVRQGGPRL
jgi:hypothetical protein